MTTSIRAISLTCFLCMFAVIGNAEICSSKIKVESSLAQTAVNNLYGALPSLQHAVEKLEAKGNVEFCTSAVIVDRDIYQYGRYYIRIDADQTPSHTSLAHFRFLFQDASVQALDSPQTHFWPYLSYAVSQKIEQAMLSNDESLSHSLGNVAGATTLDLAKRTITFKKDQADLSTMSSISLSPLVSLVTWIAKSQRQDNNIFAEEPITDGVLIEVNPLSRQASAVEHIWLGEDLTNPLNDELMRTQRLASSTPHLNLDQFLLQLAGM